MSRYKGIVYLVLFVMWAILYTTWISILMKFAFFSSLTAILFILVIITRKEKKKAVPLPTALKAGMLCKTIQRKRR